MFCEHCGDTNGEETGIDHDERDCPWDAVDGTPIEIAPEDLAEIAQARAEGSPAQSAAVHLLVQHGHWIARLAERPGLLLIGYDEGKPEPYGIDWPMVAALLAAKGLVGSSGELGILAIAASLADSTVPVRLGDAVSSLDASNLDLVLKAIAQANGRTHPATS
ncbi:hypothetical protein GR925_38745 [Streptomyces sp. HUCO-GS316]|uniref:hypothetical protein n=1 Tax=Streptomyces sp. HUCO-GS316 TaxID=2692198 RepID=UPI00136EAA3E|nr:hypothetical protein [Streptomyces sp. HUCO-GS316]MXM69174.1 hypothetical protein [Streptomyces sp. HUCO-GS316]